MCCLCFLVERVCDSFALNRAEIQITLEFQNPLLVVIIIDI